MGYFQQYLNQDGWQQDFYQVNDFHNMQVLEVKGEDDAPIEIELDFPGRRVHLKVWKILVGRVALYLLDSNLEKNSPGDRQLTAQLYGGDKEIRLQQEIILGIGGVRMLHRLGQETDVLHMNEGHSAFAPFERARLLMQEKGLTFAEAMVITRKTSVFTTHTNVQAGHDEFPPDLIRKYFADYIKGLGISSEEFLAFGRVPSGKSGRELPDDRGRHEEFVVCQRCLPAACRSVPGHAGSSCGVTSRSSMSPSSRSPTASTSLPGSPLK